MFTKIQQKRVFKLADEEVLRFVSELPITCTLDGADKGGMTLDAVAKAGYKNIEKERMTRERVRQIEVKALKKVERRMKFLRLDTVFLPLGGFGVEVANGLRELRAEVLELLDISEGCES